MMENAISSSSLYSPGSTLNYSQAAMMGLTGSHGSLPDTQQLGYPSHSSIPNIILTGEAPLTVASWGWGGLLLGTVPRLGLAAAKGLIPKRDVPALQDEPCQDQAKGGQTPLILTCCWTVWNGPWGTHCTLDQASCVPCSDQEQDRAGHSPHPVSSARVPLPH